MPVLPTIRPLRGFGGAADYGRVTPAEYGAGIGRELGDIGDTMLKLQDGANKAEAARIAGTTKEQLDASLEGLNDTVSDPAEFQKQAAANRQAILDQLGQTTNERAKTLATNGLQPHLLAYDAKAAHYGRLKLIDQAKGDYLLAKDQFINAAGKATSEAEQQSIARNFGQLVANQLHNGFMKPEQASKELLEFKYKVPEKIADGYLNRGDFQGLDKFKENPLYQALPADVQLRIDQRQETLYNRQRNEEYGASLDLDRAWLDQNRDKILADKNTAASVQQFMNANKDWFRPADVIFMRKMIGAMLGPEGNASAQKDGVLADYEDERLRNGGITTPALAAKTFKAIDAAGLDSASMQAAKRQVNSDLERADALQRTLASQGRAIEAYTRGLQTYQENQQQTAVKQAIAAAMDPTKMTPEDRKQFEQAQFVAKLGGRNVQKDLNDMAVSAMEEHTRTGENAALIIKRKIDEYKKNILPKPQPQLSPEEKALMDRLGNLKPNAGPK